MTTRDASAKYVDARPGEGSLARPQRTMSAHRRALTRRARCARLPHSNCRASAVASSREVLHRRGHSATAAGRAVRVIRPCRTVGARSTRGTDRRSWRARRTGKPSDRPISAAASGEDRPDPRSVVRAVTIGSCAAWAVTAPRPPPLRVQHRQQAREAPQRGLRRPGQMDRLEPPLPRCVVSRLVGGSATRAAAAGPERIDHARAQPDHVMPAPTQLAQLPDRRRRE